MQYLTHLQELHIEGIQATELDLSACTQLVHVCLDIGDEEQPLRHLVLPFGPDVHLKDLQLTSKQINRSFVLENLSQAHLVSHIYFSRVNPKNLTEGDWPSNLPHLQSISFSRSNYVVPQQFLGYPHLVELELADYTPNHLPDWFSGLTQLSPLYMEGCNLNVFPVGVLCLSRLVYLTIMNCPAVKITKDIMRMADWGCLENLSLTVFDAGLQSHSLDSRLYLLELCQCLTARGVAVDLSVIDLEDEMYESERSTISIAKGPQVSSCVKVHQCDIIESYCLDKQTMKADMCSSFTMYTRWLSWRCTCHIHYLTPYALLWSLACLQFFQFMQH